MVRTFKYLSNPLKTLRRVDKTLVMNALAANFVAGFYQIERECGENK